jgi:hypothetical protein
VLLVRNLSARREICVQVYRRSCQRRRFVATIESQLLEHGALVPMHRSTCSPPVCCHDAEAELQRICQRRDSLCSARVFANHHGFPPVGHIHADPTSKEWFGDEVVDRALKEALHLGSVQVEGNDVVNAGDVKEVRNHARSNGPAMLLLLRLARVGEVRHDSWCC